MLKYRPSNIKIVDIDSEKFKIVDSDNDDYEMATILEFNAINSDLSIAMTKEFANHLIECYNKSLTMATNKSIPIVFTTTDGFDVFDNDNICILNTDSLRVSWYKVAEQSKAGQKDYLSFGNKQNALNYINDNIQCIIAPTSRYIDKFANVKDPSVEKYDFVINTNSKSVEINIYRLPNFTIRMENYLESIIRDLLDTVIFDLKYDIIFNYID